MPNQLLRVLLLADTHIGFDQPLRPRVERPRRGPDFFANTERALAPARRGEVDLVVHGGDLLYRSKVPVGLVQAALEPLLAVADAGVPVVLVPGNHERSVLPYPLLAAHDRLHLLDRPRTVLLEAAGLRVAVAGFPCERDEVRSGFTSLLAASGWQDDPADIRLLCIHQAVEGAVVGPAEFVFRDRPDVVRGRDLPHGVAAVLAGHIHRHQVLRSDLSGRPLAAPVLYPGSVERTSFVERDERKGYLILGVAPDAATGGRLEQWSFHELPARPMVELALTEEDLARADLERWLVDRLEALDQRAIVRLRLEGEPEGRAAVLLRAASLRDLAPPDMIVNVRFPR